MCEFNSNNIVMLLCYILADSEGRTIDPDSLRTNAAASSWQ
jgi:hypothetical protein